MLSIRKGLVILLLLMLPVACIEPYLPAGIDHEPVLFIQALITDNPDIQPYVQLANTRPLFNNTEQTEDYIQTTGAFVFIRTENGSEYWFYESLTMTGKYVPASPFPQLEEGSWYQLVVITAEGYRLESEHEYYLSSPPIDSITHRAVAETVIEGQRIEQGYRFYVHTTASGPEINYYRWALDYTYRYFVPYQGDYMWTGTRRVDSTSYNYTFCYMDGVDNGIYVGSTAGFSPNRIAGAPLNFVSQYGDYLRLRYSLHAYQYRISQNAFNFWFNLRKMMYETGGLYETQPFRLRGNIHCVSHSDINVTGIFEVAGVSEKRVFVSQPLEFPTYSDLVCKADTIGRSTAYPQWSAVPAGSYLMDLGDGIFMTAPNECFDCRLKGGYLATPSFWESK
jgi:hypothetical protein